MSKREDYEQLQERLQQRRSELRFRSLETIEKIQSSRWVQINSKQYLNFSSNDYLNLSNHSYLKEKSAEYSNRFGTGVSSSRLITGTMAIHRELEERIASLYKKEDALIFSTGFQANSTIFPAITEEKDVIVADELCHNSILTGCLASRANFYRFRHNDLNHLEIYLKRKSKTCKGEIWIVTESLFSMNGDRAPLEKIISLASDYHAKLYVDDAHAFGVNGRNGLGYGADYPEIDLLLGTFGKAGGAFGAYVASTNTVIETLINYCNGFIYTTAIPPAVVGSIEAALDLIPTMESERNHLADLSNYFHKGITGMNVITSEEPSHILPIILGSEEKVLNHSRELRKQGIIATAIRPPSVPENSCRFRISLTSAHQKSDCDKLLGAIQA